jgi:hypothetical protein
MMLPAQFLSEGLTTGRPPLVLLVMGIGFALELDSAPDTLAQHQ